VDDHSLFRESLSRLLQAEADFCMVGDCGSVSEALAALDNAKADIVLLDYDLGEEQGLVFLEEARKRGIDSRVLVVTAGMSDADTLRALEKGASGVFLKHSPPGELMQAIYRVAVGEMWIDPKAVGSLVAGAQERSKEQRGPEPLNDRERAALSLLFEGLTNKEIAVKLEISENAVKWVVQQLFEKTGVRTRSQLVRIALEKRLLG
jgi:two-component system, NarL family, nitrate/nitrite response regulator NarL